MMVSRILFLKNWRSYQEFSLGRRRNFSVANSRGLCAMAARMVRRKVLERECFLNNSSTAPGIWELPTDSHDRQCKHTAVAASVSKRRRSWPRRQERQASAKANLFMNFRRHSVVAVRHVARMTSSSDLHRGRSASRSETDRIFLHTSVAQKASGQRLCDLLFRVRDVALAAREPTYRLRN